jgi:hypothetical protein
VTRCGPAFVVFETLSIGIKEPTGSQGSYRRCLMKIAESLTAIGIGIGLFFLIFAITGLEFIQKNVLFVGFITATFMFLFVLAVATEKKK